VVRSRDLFQCTACRRQTSPIAGTIFASTKLPLRIWFRAMYHLTQSKQGISSIELGRRLGVTQTTAWKVKHKLKQVMMERDGRKQLTGRVEIDDAYLGGERPGGKRGRGAPGKTPFVAAVETTPEGKPVRLKLSRVGTYRSVNSKHVPRYLAEFQYRFNRRYDLAAMLPRLCWASTRTPPMPYRLLKLAEVYA
jgi:hypothetical protein